MVPWANGLGTTSVIARRPDDEQWAWRLSLARVTADGPFSSLPGIDRVIAVASGKGMALTIDDDPPVPLDDGSAPLAFDGGADVHCRLLDGPIVDLNLMTRRGTALGEIELCSVATEASLMLEAGVVAMVVLEGTIECAEGRLDCFDALLDPAPASVLRAVTPARLALAHVHLVDDPSPTLALRGD